MTFTIKVSLAVALIIALLWSFATSKMFETSGNDYGIGAFIQGIFNMMGWLLIAAVYFAGAYYAWWVI